MEESARCASEERQRQRLRATELAAERRKAEIRAAVQKADVGHDAAAERFSANRQSPRLRFEQWLGRACRCPAPSRCSSELGKLLK